MYIDRNTVLGVINGLTAQFGQINAARVHRAILNDSIN